MRESERAMYSRRPSSWQRMCPRMSSPRYSASLCVAGNAQSTTMVTSNIYATEIDDFYKKVVAYTYENQVVSQNTGHVPVYLTKQTTTTLSLYSQTRVIYT